MIYFRVKVAENSIEVSEIIIVDNDGYYFYYYFYIYIFFFLKIRDITIIRLRIMGRELIPKSSFQQGQYATYRY